MKQELLDTVRLSNRSIQLMANAMGELRMPAAPLFAQAGLDPALLKNPAGTVLGAEELRFQRAFVDATHEHPDAWFRLGETYRASSFPLLGPAMLSAKNVEEGLDLVPTFQGLTYDMLQYQPYGQDGVLLGFEATHHDVPEGMHEFVWLRGVAAATSVVREMCPSLPIQRIEIPLAGSPRGVDLERSLGVPIRYGSSVLRWVFAPDASRIRLPRASPLLAEAYRSRCAHRLGRKSEDLAAERLVPWLLRSLGRAPSAADASAFLGVSRRTLYRQLERAETTYGALLTRVREERARHLLKNSRLTVESIALKLGFSETASFSRAFKRWTGASPSAFRGGDEDDVNGAG